MSIFGFLQSLWRCAAAWLRPAPSVEPLPEVLRAPAIRRPRREAEHYGAHYYLGDLLDRLEDYFDALKALNKANPKMVDNIKQFGCSVFSSDALLEEDIERAFVASDYPTFGCCHYGSRDTGRDRAGKWTTPEFITFLKVRRPINVQATNYTIYNCCIVYRLDGKFAVAEFYISIAPDSTVKALKECSPRYHEVGKHGKTHTFARMEWAYPVLLQDWVRRRKSSADEEARAVFGLITNAAAMTEQGIAVRVKKAGRVAAFSIDMLRTPYFFSDRDKTVNVNGRTQRILHIVRPHTRGDGRVIKAHFRGLRRFSWNGYDVSIAVPGLHYRPLMELNASTVEEIDVPEGTETTDLAGLASILDERMTAA